MAQGPKGFLYFATGSSAPNSTCTPAQAGSGAWCSPKLDQLRSLELVLEYMYSNPTAPAASAVARAS